MRTVVRWIWNFIAHASQAWQIWVWLASASVVPAMTGYLAIVANVPAYAVVLSVLGAFCLISVGVAAVFQALLRYNEWHHRTTVYGKLEYVNPFLLAMFDGLIRECQNLSKQ
jgi:hypothetical protein